MLPRINLLDALKNLQSKRGGSDYVELPFDEISHKVGITKHKEVELDAAKIIKTCKRFDKPFGFFVKLARRKLASYALAPSSHKTFSLLVLYMFAVLLKVKVTFKNINARNLVFFVKKSSGKYTIIDVASQSMLSYIERKVKTLKTNNHFSPNDHSVLLASVYNSDIKHLRKVFSDHWFVARLASAESALGSLLGYSIVALGLMLVATCMIVKDILLAVHIPYYSISIDQVLDALKTVFANIFLDLLDAKKYSGFWSFLLVYVLSFTAIFTTASLMVQRVFVLQNLKTTMSLSIRLFLFFVFLLVGLIFGKSIADYSKNKSSFYWHSPMVQNLFVQFAETYINLKNEPRISSIKTADDTVRYISVMSMDANFVYCYDLDSKLLSSAIKTHKEHIKGFDFNTTNKQQTLKDLRNIVIFSKELEDYGSLHAIKTLPLKDYKPVVESTDEFIDGILSIVK